MTHSIRQQDIASLLGVSISTVSLALRNAPQVADETKIMIRETASQLGYRLPPTDLKQHNQVKCISYISSNTADDHFYGKILNGVEASCRQHNITLHYSHLQEINDRALNDYLETDGLLLVGSTNPDVVMQLKALNRPMVLVDSNQHQMGLDRVVTENQGSVFQIVFKLFDWGYRKIAFMHGPEGHPSFVERWLGYRTAMEALRLETNEIICDEAQPNYVTHAIQESWAKQNGTLNFDAIIVFNDCAAIEVQQAIKNLGLRIPEDIAVVGFDDIDISNLIHPSLTTLHVDRERLGRAGLERLLFRIHNPHTPTVSIAIDPTLVIRQSAGPQNHQPWSKAGAT